MKLRTKRSCPLVTREHALMEGCSSRMHVVEGEGQG